MASSASCSATRPAETRRQKQADLQWIETLSPLGERVVAEHSSATNKIADWNPVRELHPPERFCRPPPGCSANGIFKSKGEFGMGGLKSGRIVSIHPLFV